MKKAILILFFICCGFLISGCYETQKITADEICKVYTDQLDYYKNESKKAIDYKIKYSIPKKDFLREAYSHCVLIVANKSVPEHWKYGAKNMISLRTLDVETDYVTAYRGEGTNYILACDYKRN